MIVFVRDLELPDFRELEGTQPLCQDCLDLRVDCAT